MKEIHFLLRTVVGKVVEHHSRCANCVAILIIPTFFLIYKYIKCDTSVALCSFCLRVTHTIFLYLLSLPHSPHLLTLLHSSFRCHFNLLSTFFFSHSPIHFVLSPLFPFRICFVLFSFFLSFFFLTHSHRWVLSAHSCTCFVLFFLCLSHRFYFISLVFQFSFFYITLHAHIHAAHISACLVFSYSYWAIYSLYLLNS